jgi:hypothetical protein
LKAPLTWDYGNAITFVVQITGARRSAIRIVTGSDAELVEMATEAGTLEGGQGIAGVGGTVGKEVCRWSEVSTTIYKWTPPPSSSGYDGEAKIEIVAIGGKSEKMYFYNFAIEHEDGAATTNNNPSGSTAPTSGKTEAAGIKCGAAFSTDGIVSAVGANTADGSSVTFACTSPKQPSGQAKCVNGIWSDAKCVTVGAQCAAAFTTDLITAPVGAGTAHDGTVTFTCTDGAVKSKDAKCQNGVWSDDAQCLAKCKIPYYTEDIGSLTGLNTPSGSSVTFTCLSGKVASGKATCTNGKWDSPTCIESKVTTSTTANPDGGQDAGSHATPTALATAAVLTLAAGLFQNAAL